MPTPNDLAAETRLDAMMSAAFDANDEPMLDYARMKFRVKSGEVLRADIDKVLKYLKAVVNDAEVRRQNAVSAIEQALERFDGNVEVVNIGETRVTEE